MSQKFFAHRKTNDILVLLKWTYGSLRRVLGISSIRAGARKFFELAKQEQDTTPSFWGAWNFGADKSKNKKKKRGIMIKALLARSASMANVALMKEVTSRKIQLPPIFAEAQKQMIAGRITQLVPLYGLTLPKKSSK
jgi:hypothetical protein